MSSYELLKKHALARKRRVIFDNDGCDVLYECREVTKEELLKQRMYQLLNTRVDTVFCASMSSGFGQFTHDTKIGSVFTNKEGNYKFNKTEDFIRNGTDHFRIISDFCKENSIEIFWQMRMNDTHDGSIGTWYADLIFKGNKLKNEHPEWMLGSKDNIPKHGAWSAVNYAIPEIRDLVLAFIEEVCDNYYIDGINLDFFRHPVFFKSTAEGRSATQDEIDIMTELMRKIKQLVERKGIEKNHPILIAIRVPDSLEYALAIGLDIEKWLREKLLDLLVTTSYIKLNNEEYSVKLGHMYEVKVYPSLDESRVKDTEGRTLRESIECYRARSMNALRAGTDGIYLFNYKAMDFKEFKEDNKNVFDNIGDIEELNKLDKTYVVSARGVGEIAGGGLPHREYIKIPVLNPDEPLLLENGKDQRINFLIGDDVNWGMDSGVYPKISLGVRLEGIKAETDIFIEFNCMTLKDGKENGIWLEYEVCTNTVKQGMNELALCVSSANTSTVKLLDLKVDIKYIRS